MPLYSHYDELVQNRDGLENSYVNLIQMDIETAIDSVEHHMDLLHTYQSRFENRLLHDANLNALMPVLDGYCSNAGLKVLSLEPLNRKEKVGEYTKLFASVTMRGTYPEFLTWLKKLEDNPQWLLIERLVISPLDKTDEQQFSVDLSVLQGEVRSQA